MVQYLAANGLTAAASSLEADLRKALAVKLPAPESLPADLLESLLQLAMRQAFDVLRALRRCGVAVHAWP